MEEDTSAGEKLRLEKLSGESLLLDEITATPRPQGNLERIQRHLRQM